MGSNSVPAKPEDREFGVEINQRTPELIEKYGIRPNPIVIRGGLEDIKEGFAEMRVSLSESGEQTLIRSGWESVWEETGLQDWRIIKVLMEHLFPVQHACSASGYVCDDSQSRGRGFSSDLAQCGAPCDSTWCRTFIRSSWTKLHAKL